MIYSWSNIVGIIVLFLKVTCPIRRGEPSCSNVTTTFVSVHYVEIGGHVHLHPGAYMVHSAWLKDGRTLVVPKCKKNEFNCTNAKFFTYENYTNLRLENVTTEDSGKYIVKITCPRYRAIHAFEVIVVSDPSLFIDCQDMVVYEGEDISCICKATNNNSAAAVTWIWNKTEQDNLETEHFTGLLTLVNVTRSQSGRYTCKAKGNSSVKDKSFNLEVMQKGSSSIATSTNVPDNPDSNKENVETDSKEWKIRFIIAACSCLTGIIMSCILISCKRLCSEKKRDGISIYDDVSPKTASKGVKENCPEENDSVHEYDVPEAGNMGYKDYHELNRFHAKHVERY